MFDAVIYAPRGYLYAGGIAGVEHLGRGGHLARLDSGYTLADPARMQRVTMGDLVGNQAGFARPVRLLGVQFGSDFAIRPDLVTTPLPALNGEAAVPSIVDLVVNGAKRAAGEVKAGQFAVADIPVQSGVNTITVAVRDALGRATTRTVSTYSSRALLRLGLSAFSLEAGLIRTGYATADDRYRELAAAAHWRAGLTDRLTVEAQAQLGDGVRIAGVGAALGLGAAGLVEVAAAADDKGATQLSVSFERVARPISLSARYARNSGDWFDLATRYGSVTRSHNAVLNLGVDLGRAGTVSASLIDLGSGRISRASPARPSWSAPTPCACARNLPSSRMAAWTCAARERPMPPSACSQISAAAPAPMQAPPPAAAGPAPRRRRSRAPSRRAIGATAPPSRPAASTASRAPSSIWGAPATTNSRPSIRREWSPPAPPRAAG
jgi:outer membrane usher protein